MTQLDFPHLAITLGDPAGIGPEVVLKALSDPSVRENCYITIIGKRSLLQTTYEHLKQLPHLNPQDLAAPDTLSILEVAQDLRKKPFSERNCVVSRQENGFLSPGVSPINQDLQRNPFSRAENGFFGSECISPVDTPGEIILGQGNAASGAASFAYLEAAIARTLGGEFQGIVTAPIAKSCWKAAGYNYPGQTEVLAQRAGVKKFGMLFVARSPYTGFTLRTLLATTHIPLNQVSVTLNPALMTLKLELLIDSLERDFGINNPEIAIAGLNPHSGEQGQLGTEEQEWLIPWLETARKKYPQVQLIGPIPPDTMWVKPGQAWFHDASQDKPADAYLALYHDQGLIPVKLMAFEQAINTTIGLPFIRTSPDHGTAFDIAGKGIAKPDSMKEAIKLAKTINRRI